jgi:hypothetical protein
METRNMAIASCISALRFPPRIYMRARPAWVAGVKEREMIWNVRQLAQMPASRLHPDRGANWYTVLAAVALGVTFILAASLL